MKKYFLAVVLSFGALFSNAQTTGALAVGSKAPAIKGKTNQGKFNLKSATKDGSVVVVFYRGNWCPYCSKQLTALNDSLQLLKDKGASVVAITPETMDGVSKTVGKTKASFPILSDKKLKISKAYQVNFTLDEKTVEKYKGYGIDLGKTNGENGNNLPVPAVYIIGKDGTIKYAYFDKDYSKRPTVASLLAQL